jgi:sec-independent protein translocase protein TatC
MSLLDHLGELRNRFIWSFLSLVAGTAIGLIFAGQIMQVILDPYARLFPDGGRQLIVLGPTGAIGTYLRVALLVGGVITVPTITYQILAFIVPGLTPKERRYVLSSIPAIAVLFVAGVLFCWLILIPPAVRFLAGFQDGIFASEWEAGQYVSFVATLLFWMGIAFQTPLVFFILSLLGVLTASGLSRQWRSAVVLAAVAAALITPTVDPVNMFLVMGPLLALYAISIGLVWIGSQVSRRR